MGGRRTKAAVLLIKSPNKLRDEPIISVPLCWDPIRIYTEEMKPRISYYNIADRVITVGYYRLSNVAYY